MKAVLFNNKLAISTDYPNPDVPSGWALIKVIWQAWDTMRLGVVYSY